MDLLWTCHLPAAALTPIQAGSLRTRYKGLAFLKSPFDIALYTRMLDELRPGTVIEVGANEGGSALWFADMMGVFGLEPRVVSVDLPEVVARIPLRDGRIAFLPGDALRLEATLTDAVLAALPRPWLVVEDSAHLFETSLAALEFFHPRLRRGDHIVVEDGVIRFLENPDYAPLQDGPIRALEEFLGRHGEDYEVRRDVCDAYGRNVTWNPNGWLRRL